MELDSGDGKLSSDMVRSVLSEPSNDHRKTVRGKELPENHRSSHHPFFLMGRRETMKKINHLFIVMKLSFLLVHGIGSESDEGLFSDRSLLSVTDFSFVCSDNM
jgi:hypothetical protein